MKGKTKNESSLERIIMSQSENDMNNIRKLYKNIYEIDLRAAIIENIPIGDFRDLLVGLTMKSSIGL